MSTQNARDWLIASDPGLARLRMAATTAGTLAVSLGVLYLITQLAGQPLTVALLGVVVSMISSMALSDPDLGQRALTAALMMVPAAAAVTLGALLAPHKVIGDVAFVAIMVAATYARRFGMRGTMLGMVGFMTYFFALFLGATLAMVGWLILALAIGTATSFAIRTFVARDHPDRELRRTLDALRARVGAVIDALGAELTADRADRRTRRRLDHQVSRVSETALMVESQLEGLDVRRLWPGIDGDELSLRLFDLELATQHLAGAGERAATGDRELAGDARDELVGALRELRDGLRDDPEPTALRRAAGRAQTLCDDSAARSLALAVVAMAHAAERTRGLGATGDGRAPRAADGSSIDSPAAEERAADGPAAEERSSAGPRPDREERVAGGSWAERLAPSSRQAIQVGIASALAIVAGELLSSARWYWAVIAAFVIFSGTSSRGETLTKGWQRVLGTIVGVGSGVVVASLVGGNTAVSLALIFVCMFAGFYLIQVAYGLMIFWITTMLALLYGLLGEFSVGLLLTRIEETAIGAAIGILVAVLVLPTRTRTTVGSDLRDFVAGLSELVGRAEERLSGQAVDDLIARARALDRDYARLRDSAKPLTTGIAGVRDRVSVRRAIAVMGACDHYARGLARASTAAPSSGVPAALPRAAERVRSNVDALADLLDHRPPRRPPPADADLDDAEAALAMSSAAAGHAAAAAVVRYLRALDQAVSSFAADLGAPAGSPVHNGRGRREGSPGGRGLQP